MLNKKELCKIAFTGVIAGLVTAASPLTAVQGTEIARGGCGTKGCGGADKGRTKINTSSYENAPGSQSEEGNSVKKPFPDSTNNEGQSK